MIILIDHVYNKISTKKKGWDILIFFFPFKNMLNGNKLSDHKL